VVAFDATGPSDIVDHKETGWLAEAYEPAELANGIEWVLDVADQTLLSTSRDYAVKRFEQSKVAREYLKLYRQQDI
jgi:glycosyltransferase involved in cell wall biosynthesis